MGLPTECRMPDLVDLNPLLSSLALRLMFGVLGVNQKTALYLRNFVRLVDKAISEYQQSRELILAQIAEMNRPPEEMERDGRHIYVFSFPDHIETCVNAVRRLYKLLERIKSEKESPDLPRDLRRLVEAAETSVTNIRNAVEHIDEQIQNDELSPGEPIMLTLNKNNDGIVISKYELRFEELAIVLRRMHGLASYLLTIKKTESKSAPPTSATDSCT